MHTISPEHPAPFDLRRSLPLVGRRRRRYATELLAATIISLASIESGAQSVIESAGLTIVRNDSPSWTPSTAWRVDPVPLRVVGTSDGSASELRVVSGIGLLSTGEIAVADMDMSAIRVFDRAGRLVRSFGGKGRGAGEFTQLMGLAIGRGDTLIAINATGGGQSRRELFTAGGKWVRSSPFALEGKGVASPAAWNADGSWVHARLLQPEGRHMAVRHIDSVAYEVVAADGRIEVALPPMPAVIEAGRQQRAFPLLFGARAQVAFSDGRVAVGYPDRYEIRIHHGTSSPLIVRRAWTPQRVTREDIARFTEDYVGPTAGEGTRPSTGIASVRQSQLDQMVFAPRFPAYTGLMFDEPGNLWVLAPDAEQWNLRAGLNPLPTRPATYSIFSPDGRWLGDLSLPAGFALRRIGADHLLGISRDDEGVERVSMLRLIKPR